ncbi:MAG: hypothetical protein LM550_16730 [Candidatus Contendobacter sp.]|nr:hypothetical protein [Gammaproteobacteria bacterium]MCC8995288.1 hypothetical protein [Candidatus Contendobacter sp.]
MSSDRIFPRQQAANLLIWQSVLRIAGLMNLGAISAVRRALDTYLLCLQHGADYVHEAQISDPPEQWVNNYVDTLSECAEKSWQDFRNNWQILLLTQDEALFWFAKIERALAER